MKDKLFKDLMIGEEFDWINDRRQGYNSFFKRCWRNSYTGYIDEDGYQHTVGAMTAQVFHCGGRHQKDGKLSA
jgi:hypothetical protein